MSSPFDAPVSVDGFTTRKSFRLRRIGVLSVAIFSGAMGAAIGLLAAFFLMLYASLGMAQGPGAQGNNLGALAGLGAAAIIAVPLLYGFMGFIGGAINALIYNMIAGLTGGIELEFGESS